MSETQPTNDPTSQQDVDPSQQHDQDSEPTMNAPDDVRPDGLDTETNGGDGSPS